MNSDSAREQADREQNARVRERFTRSADAFANFAVPRRVGDAQTVAHLADPRPTDFAIDLACGPGTFALVLARKVKLAFGFDLTPALLDRARRKAAAERVDNLVLICGDATALPFPAASFDVATCGYSFHHMAEPQRPLAELARVLKPGARLAVVDLFVPDDADPETHNAIERARDASHTHTFRHGQFMRLVEDAGFRIRSTETLERPRLFSEWLRIANWDPTDPHWLETRRLMEATLSNDAGGFQPRLLPSPSDSVAQSATEAGTVPELEFIQSCLFIAASKR